MKIFADNFDLSLSELSAIASMEDLDLFLRRLLERYELRHAVYHAVALPHMKEANPVLVLSYPEQWIERYIEKNYFTLDPVVLMGAVSLLPFDWKDVERRAPGVQQMFGESLEFGIGRQGLSFPIRGTRGDQ